MRQQEGDRDVHLTRQITHCHSVSVLKGNRTLCQSGATDEQPGGAAFESQLHFQYGQSAAQQAHQS